MKGRLSVAAWRGDATAHNGQNGPLCRARERRRNRAPGAPFVGTNVAAHIVAAGVALPTNCVVFKINMVDSTVLVIGG